MCMRMGPDAGRNFLSTRDPVETRIKLVIPDGDEKPDARFTERHPLSLKQVLRQLYFGRSTDG
jgi:hypothetical protein